MKDLLQDYGQLITAMIATGTTILVFLIKEWSDGRRQKKTQSKEILDVFNLYGEPMALAVRSLAIRLREIFQYNARYFREEIPRNERHRYHYVSTLYRLCSVLGWIRAATREQASLNTANRRFNLEIARSLRAFESALAENPQSSGSVVRFLCEQWGLEIGEPEEEDIRRWEEKLDQMGWEFSQKHQVKRLHELTEESVQLELVSQVADFLSKAVEAGPVSEETLGSNRRKAFGALGRKEGWIFRDWQHAIGDLMIRENNSEFSPRRLEVIGYREFERLFLGQDQSNDVKRWMDRVDRLFRKLNLSSDDRIDARPQQLRNILSAATRLLNVLEQADQETDLFTPEELEELLEFAREINPEYQIMK